MLALRKLEFDTAIFRFRSLGLTGGQRIIFAKPGCCPAALPGYPHQPAHAPLIRHAQWTVPSWMEIAALQFGSLSVCPSTRNIQSMSPGILTAISSKVVASLASSLLPASTDLGFAFGKQQFGLQDKPVADNAHIITVADHFAEPAKEL